MTKTGFKHHIDGLLIVLLFGVFASCILSVLLTGAQVYRGLNARDQNAYARRTCAQYLATKVRQSAGQQAVSLGTFGDSDALILSQTIDADSYVTVIYCYDGWLRELFCFDPDDFLPQDGEKVLPAQSLHTSLEQDLLRLALVDESGNDVCLLLAPRGAGEVAT